MSADCDLPMSFCFPRSARVRTRGEYARAFERARRISDPLLAVHWAPGQGAARLGLAVSRKVDRRAVGRNRIKRTLREAFRHVHAQLPGGDYVVVVRPAAAQASSTGLREAFLRTLTRAGALPSPAAAGTMRPAAPSAVPPPLSRPAPDSPGA